MLFPRESESREVKDLSGIWRFKADKNNEGFKEEWYLAPLKDTIIMPVPSSYNDITQDITLRDHIGDVWYERDFFVPDSMKGKRLVLRAGSITHHGTVWVNGIKIAEHKGGYLPVEGEISGAVNFNAFNRVTIAVNNILDWTTLPPGEIKVYNDDKHPAGYKTQEYFHDFFNYAGIHRPVRVYTTPVTYISDINVTTGFNGDVGLVNYDVAVENGNPVIKVSLFDEAGKEVAASSGAKGKLEFTGVHLWMPGGAYLYTLAVSTLTQDNEVEDCYRLPVGIRTVEVKGKEFLINNKPFYFKGFGKHEDTGVHGKGLDEVMNVKDFNLLKWMGANSFRTSHYPYSEEIMDMADREGIVVIDETPAVGMNFFTASEKVFVEGRVSDATLEHHLQVMHELIARDKNHPCVVMWSIANEAAAYEENAIPYFRKVAAETRKLDPTRPITMPHDNDTTADRSPVNEVFDVISVNRYYGWYIDSGHLEVSEYRLEKDLKEIYGLFNKPVLITEYGADSIAGFHQDPPVMFSEEFQCEMLDRFHRVFDSLDFVIGEHVWNFADFATKQGITRVVGNKKGVFTRERNPKAAAYLLKKRWTKGT